MVLTKQELLAALQDEVRILLHLAGKIDRSQLDYRPTPKQRSTLELLRYLVNMGPRLIAGVKAGAFDVPGWQAAQERVNKADFDEVLAMLAKQSDEYAELLADFPDEDFRDEIEMFGGNATRGTLIVKFVLGGHAAYRTQLFLYLKSCGREELSTMNLWAGMDAPVAAA